jgi:hypothetical protein
METSPVSPINGNGTPGKDQLAGSEITRELVEKVAEKVIAMLLLDLQVQRERYRPGKTPPNRPGGWR